MTVVIVLRRSPDGSVVVLGAYKDPEAAVAAIAASGETDDSFDIVSEDVR